MGVCATRVVVVLLDLLLDLLSCFIVSMFIYPFFYSVPFAIVFRVSVHFFFPRNGRFSLFDQKPKTHTHALLFLFTQVAYKHLKPTTGRDILNLSLSLCLCVCHVVVF